MHFKHWMHFSYTLLGQKKIHKNWYIWHDMAVCSFSYENAWDWLNFLCCAWRTFSSLSVCQWISALSIFCGPCRFPVWACWDYRTTCFKAGNDCVYHRIGDNKFIVLIPNIITCHLHRTRDFFLSSLRQKLESENWCSFQIDWTIH